MRKKVVSALLCTAVAVSLAACGGQGTSETTGTSTQGASGEQTEAAAPETQAAGEALTAFGEVPEDVDREQTITFAQGQTEDQQQVGDANARQNQSNSSNDPSNNQHQVLLDAAIF